MSQETDKNLLIIDDNVSVRNFLNKFAELFWWNVETLASLEDVQAFFASENEK